MVNLLSLIFLEKEPGETIVHDPRIIWGIQNIVRDNGGSTDPVLK